MEQHRPPGRGGYRIAPPCGTLLLAPAVLEAASGRVQAEARQDLANPPQMTLPMAALGPGTYTLRLTVRDAAGNQCSA